MLGDRESEIRTAAQLARAYARSGRPGAGRDLLTPLLDGSQQMKEVSEHPETHALLLTALADVCFHGGDYREQLASSERAVSLWRAIGNAPSLVDALDLHGVALRLLGQWQDALRELQEVASLMEQTGALYVGAHAGNHLCYCYLQSGQWNLAVAAIERAQNAAERAGSGSMLGGAYFPRGLQSFYAGDWPTARMWFERAADLLGGKLYSISLYAPLGRGIIRLATGEKETGLNFLLEALALAEQRGFLFGKDRIQRELAEAELVMGRASSALMRLESRVTQPVRQEENDVTPMMPLLAWVYLELGGGQDVEALLDRAAAQARIQHHHLALVDTMRIRGLLYARQRRWQEAAHALDEALALCRSMPHPYAEAKALYIYGQMHLARDEPERAREDFTAALAILNRLGERLYAEHVERALAEIDG
jgi:tetratricopeptide (TPR) repeat protein